MTEPDPDAAGANALAAYRAGKRPAGLADGGGMSSEFEVTPDLTAARLGSGDLPVLGSPAIMRDVEEKAVAMGRRHLPAEFTTVGVSFDIAHSAPTPVGALVTIDVWLERGDSRTLRFTFSARDEGGLVASGSHVRVIIERNPFMANAASRSTRGTPSAD